MSQPSVADPSATSSDAQSPPVSAPRKETLFHLVARSARNVLLAADFTGWDQAPLKMVKAVGGIWNIKVLLPPGRYRYRFLIDHGKAEPERAFPLPFGTLSGMVEVRD